MRVGSWATTYTGRRLWIRNPDPLQIVVEDIAAHLAKICRFCGACREFYSVAQHCVIASRIVEPTFAPETLFHDGHEYILNDMIRPVKAELGPEYDELALMWDHAIARRFGLSVEVMHSAPIKHADAVVLATERRDLLTMPSDHEQWPWFIDEAGTEPLAERIVPLAPEAARHAFIERFLELNMHHRSAA